ncbi:gamma-glutamylcyclotransferase family protein [Halomonas sp. GXIMD04776]|uniref:gamma-glutamylcyclotransferase family protein n=1 Tax=Halomonas sp. GXIMD04776 TaxID=3415605 RepID=UPI003C8FA400
MFYYFAYGSNMNVERVAACIGSTRRALAGTLHGFELRFDKASRIPGIAHANVAPKPDQTVEGALFELTKPGQIELMDPFEGVPHDYLRERHTIMTAEGGIEAWVYIARPERTRASLRPAREYLEHLLAGEMFLSPELPCEIVARRCRRRVVRYHLDDARAVSPYTTLRNRCLNALSFIPFGNLLFGHSIKKRRARGPTLKNQEAGVRS